MSIRKLVINLLLDKIPNNSFFFFFFFLVQSKAEMDEKKYPFKREGKQIERRDIRKRRKKGKGKGKNIYYLVISSP